MEVGQQNRFSKQEIDLLRNTFEKDESLLYEIRDVFFGFKETLSIQLSGEVLRVIEKVILPDLSEDVPLGHQSDLYALSLRSIGELLPEMALNQIKANDIGIDYLERRFDVLTGVEDTGLTLQQLRTNTDDRLINMLAYKILVDSYIDTAVTKLKLLANYKEETAEEKEKRMAMSS